MKRIAAWLILIVWARRSARMRGWIRGCTVTPSRRGWCPSASPKSAAELLPEGTYLRFILVGGEEEKVGAGWLA